MLTAEDRAVAVGRSVDPARWQVVWDEAMARIAGRFTRVEPRRTARAFLAGLLSSVERKNCWWLAEHAGHRGPQRMQRMLRKAVWDADQVRDDVRDLVVEALGRPDGVLIADETGFLKTPEIRHLIDTLMINSCRNPIHLLYWSIWRRCHQATARRAHYRHRLIAEFQT